MNAYAWLQSEIGYGEEVIQSAVEGARSAAKKSLEEEPPEFLTRSARNSVASAAFGASVALLAYLPRTRRSRRGALTVALLGGALGFVGGAVLSTRHVTAHMARGAITNINSARDAHWLAQHPVDYA
jgi:hypothetical protein